MIRRICRDAAGFLIFWGVILGALIIVSPQ
jgi:hypothetical protein